jgi:Zn-dependent membrane protease YugP
MKRFINGVNDFTEFDKAKRQLELLKENKFKMNKEKQTVKNQMTIADKLFVISIIALIALSSLVVISIWI